MFSCNFIKHKKQNPMKLFIEKPNLLKEKTFVLATRIVKLNRYLTSSKNEFVISKQVLRSGTNPGAMIREAEFAQSGEDFIHKLTIALKETNETLYWIELLWQTGYLDESQFKSLLFDTKEVLKLLISSIQTRRKNLSLKTRKIS